ncbi:MAG: TOBE domain-containing protein, partial [Chloroflexota bacterium]|nr:TOBE domain-containing protein [Chloroflexota bacterium]
TRFVAGFLGISNLISGRLDGTPGSDDRYAVLRLADDTAVRVPRGQTNGQATIEIGVRPEKIRMHSADGEVPAASNQLAGTVRDASYLGVSTQYIVETRDGELITVYEQNVERTVHGSLHRPGEEVRLSWSPDHTFAVRPEPGPEEALAAG